MKVRLPDCFEDAATIAAGQLGFERMGRVAEGRSASAARKWTDPDQDGRLSIHQALLIDVACAQHPSGDGATPFFTAYKRQLDAMVRSSGATGDLLSEAIDVPIGAGALLATIKVALAADGDAGRDVSTNERFAILAEIKRMQNDLDDVKSLLSDPAGGEK